MTDLDNADSEMTWTYSGETDLAISIDENRVATVSAPNENWNGSEAITFTATDPGGLANSDPATFAVSAVNDAPVVSDIPAQSIAEGESFTNIPLDDFVNDVDNADSEIDWTYSGNTELTVAIDENRVATVTIPSENWNGSELITFTASDPGELSNNDTVAFTVTAVNDAPVVSDIADQTIDEGSAFATINLDDFVADADNADSEITWTYGGNTDLTVSIDENRVATITIPLENWNGSETITFTATDPGSSFQEDAAIFTVNAVNDAPVVADIADVSIREGLSFAPVNLDDYVSDVDNSDSEIIWSYSGNNQLSVSIDTNRVLTVTVPDENWNGSEKITFIATDPGALSASDSASFTITPVNDAPILVDLPETIAMDDTASYVFSLNDFVDDIDTPDSDLTWGFFVDNDSLLWDFNEETAELTLSARPFDGSVNLIVTVVDDSLASDSDTITVNINLVTALEDELANIIPIKYSLGQNYPNPFNPSTKIRFGLPTAGRVKIEVFNIIGQKVITLFDEIKPAGHHLVEYDASNLSSGIYFYRIQSKKFIQVRKMILMK